MTDRIPLAIPDLRGKEADYLVRCVTDNWVSSAGPEVGKLEARMANLSRCAHGVATVNGTAALHLALIVAGIGAGNRVVIPDWTFAATVNALLMVGATPVFVDVSPESWTLDPNLLDQAIREHAPSAVLPVHALGHPADMDSILAICRETGILVIEDAAGAIGATCRDRPVGGFGDAAIFSFNGNKTVTAGGGGALVTNRTDWADRARALSTQSRDGAAYRYTEPAFNYRMPNVNAALGLAQLDRLDDMVSAKQAIAMRYDSALTSRDDLVPMPRCDWATSGCWLYSVRCANRIAASDLIDHLDRAGIEARLFWEALSDQPPYAQYPHLRAGVAAALSGTVVSIPCSSQLSETDQHRVTATLAEWGGPAVSAVA